MCYFIVINFFYTHFHFHHSSFLSSLFFPLHYLSFIPHLRASVFLPLLCALLSSSSSHHSFAVIRSPYSISTGVYGKLVQFITRPIYLLSYFIYFDSSVAKMCTIHSFHISAFNRYSTFICSLISFVVHSFLFALFSCCHSHRICGWNEYVTWYATHLFHYCNSSFALNLVCLWYSSFSSFFSCNACSVRLVHKSYDCACCLLLSVVLLRCHRFSIYFSTLIFMFAISWSYGELSANLIVARLHGPFFVVLY